MAEAPLAPRSDGSLSAQSASRFGFGANWRNFSARIDAERVAVAEQSLRERLGDLSDLTFLDAGCGSGLFSLAAARLGAEQVRSFDYDSDSVATTAQLRAGWTVRSASWDVERGDVLDTAYVRSLGTWDVVYSWGVLHHTGDMRAAWTNIATLVAPSGRLFISIYNEQGRVSRLWTAIKRFYQRVPARLRPLYVGVVMAPREALSAAAVGPASYVRGWRHYKRNRGMSRWHDLVDWVGGYPFEVAKPEEVFEFFHRRGFELEWMFTCGSGSGCNQFVFRRASVDSSDAPEAHRRPISS